MPMPDGNASRVDPFQQPGRQGMAPGTVENLLTDRDLSNIAKAHPPDPLTLILGEEVPEGFRLHLGGLCSRGRGKGPKGLAKAACLRHPCP